MVRKDISRWIEHKDVEEFYIGRASSLIKAPTYGGMQNRFSSKYSEQGFNYMICVFLWQGKYGQDIVR